MNRIALGSFACAGLLLGAPAHAQLFRSYLSVNGSDTNPCTIQAPCRLLPAALAAVAPGGEVWMLDSGNFNAGAVSINQSVSIIAVPGEVGSLVATGGGDAIDIAFGGLQVALRNLVIANNAISPGLDGVAVTGASTLSVENCLFVNLPGSGIKAAHAAADVHVRNSVFRDLSGFGVWAQDGPTVNVVASQFFGSDGVLAYGDAASTTIVQVSDSLISGGAEGASANTISNGAIATVSLARTVIHNSQFPLDSETNGSGFATINVTASTIAGNGYGIFQSGTGSAVQSLGNNQIGDNALGDSGTLTSVPVR